MGRLTGIFIWNCRFHQLCCESKIKLSCLTLKGEGRKVEREREKGNGNITSMRIILCIPHVLQDLEHYYLGVSIETPSDSEFYTLLRHCWTI